MTFFGLHWLDALILLSYIVAVLAVGQWLSHRVKNENDFFLAGRKLGKWFQFFLNFGNMTDPSQAATTSSSVYQQGAGGAWLGLIPLFMSPFYWFLPVWYRRVRLTTTADLFDDRFGKRFLGTFYAAMMLAASILTIGLGNIVAFKTLAPIMVKSAAEYTPAEQQMVHNYRDFLQLRHARQEGHLAPSQNGHYSELKDLYDRGELSPYVSHLSPVPFYFSSSALIAIFIVLGGLQASAVVDGLQACLVIVISFILVPFGLAKIGGFHGLHQRLPEAMFQISGSGNASAYTWYSITALWLVSLIGTVGATASMTVNGSAKTELAGRLGAVTGGFSKRFVTIAWCVCGLIAVALFGPSLPDPDQTWGLLTNTLLPMGMIGLMIVGILGGKLAYLGASSIGTSALVARNLYEPLFPGKSQRHYVIVARITIPVVLLLGIGVALCMRSAVNLMIFMIVILAIWGAPIFFIFVWRRVTETAVRIEMIACLLFIAVIPWVVSATPALRQAPSLTLMTKERTVSLEARATIEDVRDGHATAVGQKFVKTEHIEPVSVFFQDGVARVDPADLKSPKEGLGLFNAEIYLLYRLGIDVTDFTPAGLFTARYLVDCFLPIILLIVCSLLTRPDDPQRVLRFYARMKTPVLPEPEADAREVQASYANPARFDHQKIFPHSNWEFTKWDKVDTLGFLAVCASIGFVLLFFKAVLMIGS